MWYAAQVATGAGDGSTVDDPSTIAGINWATASGDTVYLLGTITRDVTVGASGTSLEVPTIIRGDYVGKEASLVNSGFHGIVISSKDYITIKNINEIAPVSGKGIRILGASSGITVDNIASSLITESSSCIDYDGHGSNITISNNSINNAGYQGIQILGDGIGNITTVRVFNNTILRPARTGIWLGHDQVSDAYAISDAKIYNNTISYTGANITWPTGDAIRIAKLSLIAGPRPSDIEVYNNTISNIGGIGIIVICTDTAKIHDNTITTTSVNSSGQALGVYGSTNYQVKNNYIDGVDSDSAEFDGHGIDLDYQEDSNSAGTFYINDTGIVCGNVIRNAFAATRTPGINMLSCQNTKVYGNSIYNCTNGFKIGIRAGGSGEWPQNNEIYNNTIVGGPDGFATGFIRQNVTIANQALEDTNSYTNNIVTNTDIGLHIELGDGVFNNYSYSVYYNNTINEQHDGTGSIASSNISTTDPLLDSNLIPDRSSYIYHAGLPVSFSATDAKGHKFNTPPTIGAYEFTSRSVAKAGRNW